jgi:hypothetical protein
MDLEMSVADWAVRAFWFLGGVAAAVVIGYVLIPAISNPAFLIAVALFICASFCVLVMIIRLVQYGFARHAFYQQASTRLGAPYARELRRADKPPWWNRLSALGKVTYWIGVLTVAFLVAVVPKMGNGNSVARAILFVVVIGALLGGLRLLRR